MMLLKAFVFALPATRSIHHPTFGRTLVAAQKEGEVLLKELPLLFFPKPSIKHVAEVWTSAPPHLKKAVLEMHAPEAGRSQEANIRIKMGVGLEQLSVISPPSLTIMRRSPLIALLNVQPLQGTCFRV